MLNLVVAEVNMARLHALGKKNRAPHRITVYLLDGNKIVFVVSHKNRELMERRLKTMRAWKGWATRRKNRERANRKVSRVPLAR